MKIYGIKNCSTVKAARNWLDQAEIEHEYVDFREQGINQSDLQNWIEQLGLKAILNTRSTTWRALPDETKSNINEAQALALILEQPTLIKRPVLDTGTALKLGFKAAEYEELFSH